MKLINFINWGDRMVARLEACVYLAAKVLLFVVPRPRVASLLLVAVALNESGWFARFEQVPWSLIAELF